MPSALGPGGRHTELIERADNVLARERQRVAETQEFIREVRRTQIAIEAFNAEQKRRRRRRGIRGG